MKKNLLSNELSKLILLIVICCLTIAQNSIAQNIPNGDIKGVVWKGAPAVEISLQQILDNEAYMVQHKLIKKIKNRRVENNEKELRKPKIMDPNSPAVSMYKDPLIDDSKALLSPTGSFVIAQSFDALTASDITQGWRPPDPMMSCGTKQLIVTVNGRIRVFDKGTGALQYDVNADVFFQSIRGNSSAVDPRVVYDVTSKRWFISSINIDFSNNRVLLAVSSSSVLTPQTTFKFMYFQQNKVGPSPNIDDNLFADYETLGVDANAVYIGCNMFNSTLHTSVFVIKKSDAINGILTATAFRNIGNSTGGPWTPQGVTNLDPTANEGYFVGTDFNLQGRLVVRRISNPGGVPSISGNLNITVPTTATPLDAPNKNGFALDALDYRLMQAMINKNTLTGEVSLWTAHAILVNSLGVGSTSGDRDAVRWYQIGNLTATPTLLQSGTLYDAASITNPKYFWMGTISMNGRGDAMIMSGLSSKDIGGNGAVAVHYSTGIGGSTSTPKATTSSKIANFDGRWGDYSASVVDPSDNLSFWGVHEYMGASEYMVRVVKITVTPSNPVESISNKDAELKALISPNPATDKIHVSIENEINKKLIITITNYSGNILSSNNIEEGVKEWDENISALNTGQYWLNISTSDGLLKKSLQFEKR